MIRTVCNYTRTVNLANPHGFPLRIEIAVTGYTLDPLTSTGRLLIRGPGRKKTVIVDSTGYTSVDAALNRYVVAVPAAAADYALIESGKPYTWSFDADVTVFRLQGDFVSMDDTGRPRGSPAELTANLGPLVIDVSFVGGNVPSSLVATFNGRSGDIVPMPDDYTITDITGLRTELDVLTGRIDIIEGGSF